jgi:hypothetical protein
MQFSEKISILHMDMFLKMIMRTVLYGTVWNLLNPQFTPEIEEEVDFSTEKDSVHNALRTLVRDLIVQYEEEQISYNPIEVREKIAEAKEKEKQGFIQIFDSITDREERKVEKIKEKLKIGRWAQGNGKLAYSYDAEDYDRRRLERGAEELVNPELDINNPDFDPHAEAGYDVENDQQREEGEE